MLGLNAPLPRMSRVFRDQEQRLERHDEMADGHQRSAQQDGAVLAEHAVGEQTAEHRCEIDQPGIKSVDLGREGLHAKRPEHRLVHLLQRAEPDDVLRLAGQQQVFHHVEHEQRASRRRSAPTSRWRTGRSGRAGGQRIARSCGGVFGVSG